MIFQLDRGRDKSLQEQIVDQIRRQIVSGALKPGTRLPSTRNLSSMLDISRNTVLFAYERLISEGYVTTRRGTRASVSEVLPDNSVPKDWFSHRAEEACDPAGQPGLTTPSISVREPIVFHAERTQIDFWIPQADPRSFPLKAWKRLLSECLSGASGNLADYGDPTGLKELRCAIAEHVARARGIVTSPDTVFVMAGAQLALNTVARLFLRGGERVVVENPCNQGAAYLFESFGATLVPLTVDDEGIISAELPKDPASLIYVTPSHQFPLGVRLSLERREHLVAYAEASGAYIIEDDYDGHFSYDGPSLPAAKALCPSRVIYLGTFSKVLGAGLRIGYAIFPERLVEKARAVKALLDNGHAWLEQAALSKFIQRGSFDRHIRLIRRTYLGRRDRLVAQLQHHFNDVWLTGLISGTHIAMRLGADWPSASDIQRTARQRGIGVYTIVGAGAQEFGSNEVTERTLLLGFGNLTEHQIDEGVARLAAVVNELGQKATAPTIRRAGRSA
jgi:GntR family transcriptional regulator/MocR family aminotransferase